MQTRLISSDRAIQSFALLQLVLGVPNPDTSLLPYFSVRPSLASRLLHSFSLSENTALKTPLFHQSILCLSRWLNLYLCRLTCSGTQHLQPPTRGPQRSAAEGCGSVTVRLGAAVAGADALGLWLRNTSTFTLLPCSLPLPVNHDIMGGSGMLT